MYREYFGLKEAPFSIAPDPRYLFMSKGHQEALAHLLYGIQNDGGFVLLTGEVGAGKTTVCRCLLEQVPDDTDIAFLLNPKLSAAELLSAVCDELGISCPRNSARIKDLVDALNAHLLDAHARGRRTVLIIEEAQNLCSDVLEQLRLLTNLETNRRKLLQIILVGQPELHEKVSRPELRQLAQRITARYHLGPLSQSETAAYVSHRLSVAGMHRTVFPPPVARRLFRMSKGVPRLINLLCDRALLGIYVLGQDRVSLRVLEQAAREVFGVSRTEGLQGKAYRWAAAALLLLLCGAALLFVRSRQPSHPSLPAAAAERLPASALQWPAGQSRSRSKELAFQELFRQWGLASVPQERGNVCTQVQELGMRCFTRQGGIRSLLLLNRPAVLRFLDSEGREFYAALTALQGQKATLVVGGERRQVEVGEMALQWTGGFTLLWKTPPGCRGEIRPGSRGPAVRWLAERLALARGEREKPAEPAAFDEALVGQVKDFQRAKGLLPDGVAGAETLLHLSSTEEEESAPSLRRKEGA
ncbi:MAG: AAA family ATPase [Thermodesulfovibrionales bacterium]